MKISKLKPTCITPQTSWKRVYGSSIASYEDDFKKPNSYALRLNCPLNLKETRTKILQISSFSSKIAQMFTISSFVKKSVISIPKPLSFCSCIVVKKYLKYLR